MSSISLENALNSDLIKYYIAEGGGISYHLLHEEAKDNNNCTIEEAEKILQGVLDKYLEVLGEYEVVFKDYFNNPYGFSNETTNIRVIYLKKHDKYVKYSWESSSYGKPWGSFNWKFVTPKKIETTLYE